MLPEQPTRTVDPEQAKLMVQLVTQFRWDTSLVEFCTALKLKQDRYAEDRYRSFQSCIDQMQGFSLTEWVALVEAAEMTSNHAVRR